MPIGVIIDVFCVAIGGCIGALIGPIVKEELKDTLNLIFGLCAIGMGIISVILLEQLPVVVISVIVGTLVGELIDLEGIIRRGFQGIQNCISNFLKSDFGMSKEFNSTFVTIVVLFCASGTGIYGTLVAGFAGENSILIAKAVLDFFTALIFACSIGISVSMIAVPQLLIFGILIIIAKLIYPIITPGMINDFKSCGGLLLLATGLRLAKIKNYPVANMIPAMVFVMPISAIWSLYIAPII